MEGRSAPPDGQSEGKSNLAPQSVFAIKRMSVRSSFGKLQNQVSQHPHILDTSEDGPYQLAGLEALHVL